MLGLQSLAHGSFRKEGLPFLGGPYIKDPATWGTLLGSSIFGNPHIAQEDSAGVLGQSHLETSRFKKVKRETTQAGEPSSRSLRKKDRIVRFFLRCRRKSLAPCRVRVTFRSMALCSSCATHVESCYIQSDEIGKTVDAE